MTQYDYIVIGAGSAGCVVANRLTEDPETTVKPLLQFVEFFLGLILSYLKL